MASAGYDVTMPLGFAPLDAVEGGTVAKRINEILGAKGHASTSTNESPVHVVCGSLFAAAEARSALYARDPSLFKENDWVGESDL